jgi:CRP-like cAMP-binding protein
VQSVAEDLPARPRFWSALPDPARAHLERVGTRRGYRRGDVLFREGDDGATVTIVLDGRVKVSVSARSGKEVILELWDAGAILGELSAVDGAPRSATVSALSDLETLVVRQAEFVTFLDEYPAVARFLLQILASKLRGTARRQLEFGAIDALGRICAVLIDLDERYGENTSGERRVELPVSQQELASLAGLSREAVVKGLATLRARGLIRTDGRHLALLDPAALAARAAEG